MHVVLMGPPAAGKGTQSNFLKQEYGMQHFSTGDELRAEIQSGSDLGKKVQSVMDAGDLVSDDIIMAIIEDRLSRPEYQNGIIFDGVVRTIPQAQGLDALLAKRGERITMAFNLKVDENILIDRVESRVRETLARGETPRKDDNVEVLKRRIQEYKTFSAVVSPYYEEKGLLTVIDGTQPIETVWQKIKQTLNP